MSSDRNIASLETQTIPIARPSFDRAEENAVCDVLRSGWVAQGPRVACFERLFADYVGSRYAVATSSGTTALHLALKAAGIGPGDEVLVPSFTFVATANAVEYTGARPVLLDIELNTFTLDAKAVRTYLESVDQAGSSTPRCLLPVSLFGLCADNDTLGSIARDYELAVIEDAACALGAYRHGVHAGTDALAGCFSFHPRKTITTGEGGMVITDDDAVARALVSLRDHGSSPGQNSGPSGMPDFDRLGYNYRMTDLQGAIGEIQMEKLEAMLRERREAAQRYDTLLASIPEIRRVFVPAGCRHAYQSYVCLYRIHDFVDENGRVKDLHGLESLHNERNMVMDALDARGIATRQGTHAVHMLGYYRDHYDYQPAQLPASQAAEMLSLALPLYVGITAEDQERVVTTLADEIKRAM